MKEDELKKIRVAAIIRVVMVIIILFVLKTPMFIKIILIMITDSLDCGIPRIIFKDNWIDCSKKSSEYQLIDKKIDVVCYIILLIAIIRDNETFIPQYKLFLLILLGYRILGVGLYIKNNNRKFLFYFPNFFLALTLAVSIIGYFSIFKKYQYLLLKIVFLIKIYQEYKLHYK